MTIQRWRASNTFTEVQWAAFLANPVARGNFSRGSFALVVADLNGAFVALFQKGQNGNDLAAFQQIAPVAGMTNPMTDVADLIVGGAVVDGTATPTRLSVGLAASKKFLRVDAAGTALEWAPEAPQLPTATAIGQVPLSTGAGTTFVATNFDTQTQTVIATAIGGIDGQTFIGDGAGSVDFTSADVSGFLAAANAAAARTAIAAATALIPDTIAVVVAYGFPTSGQSTVDITVTDSAGNPRVGTPIRVQYTATGNIIYDPIQITGTQLAIGRDLATQKKAFWLAASDIDGKIKFSCNGAGVPVISMSITVLSENPATETLTFQLP